MAANINNWIHLTLIPHIFDSIVMITAGLILFAEVFKDE